MSCGPNSIHGCQETPYQHVHMEYTLEVCGINIVLLGVFDIGHVYLTLTVQVGLQS